MATELTGSGKYLTGNPNEYVHVDSGSVYVYVINIVNEVIGRSIYLCEKKEGDDIPTLSAADSDVKSCYQFLIMAADKAVISTRDIDNDRERLRKDFLDSINMDAGETGFSGTLIKWYQDRIVNEEEIIKSRQDEQNKVRRSKIRLMSSLFKKKNLLEYESDTDSPVYNVMSVLCDYMGIEICSYQTLVNSCGNDFTINDIAGLSHFVIRRIKLGKEWYKNSEEALICYSKTGHTPVICMPHSHGRVLMYDLARQNSCVVGEEEAQWLEDYGIMIYEHLPCGKLTLKEVTGYGIKHINRSDIAAFGVMYLCITLVGLLLPMINEMFYDRLIPMSVPEPVVQVGIVMMSVMMGNILLTLVQNMASFRGVKKMEYSIMEATYDRIFRLPQKFIESFGTMELIGRINAVPTVFSSTVSAGVSAFTGMLLSLFYLWKMFDKSRPLAIRGLIMTIISGVVMYFFGRLRIEPERKRLVEVTRSNATLYQLIAGILKIKVSGIENRGLYEYQKTNVKSLKHYSQSSRINYIGNSIMILVHMFYTGFIYFTVVKKRQELSLGEYSAFNMAYGMFVSAATQLINFFLTMANMIPVMDRIKPIYEQEAENSTDSTIPGPLSGAIEVNHLEFAYEEGDEPTLKDVSLKIEPGEYIGIVGPSGSGKSTLLKCLLGFERATGGKIYYDNKDIDTLDKCDLRRRMGVVLQDGQLVMGNILTNVTLAAPDMAADDIYDLLKDVGLYEDVMQMPMGVFTNVSEGGGTVSGGQKQRILIARALANDPKIIMFDEATSALDNITQQTVCETLDRRNTTRIMIAHRLSTVKNCDRILVMDKGRIIETGNFTQLMEKKGLFYELAKRQMVS